MPLYRLYPKIVVLFESDKPTAMIESVVNTHLKDALKQAVRGVMARDTSGGTFVIEWHYHVNVTVEADGRLLAIDSGTVEEVEP